MVFSWRGNSILFFFICRNSSIVLIERLSLICVFALPIIGDSRRNRLESFRAVYRSLVMALLSAATIKPLSDGQNVVGDDSVIGRTPSLFVSSWLIGLPESWGDRIRRVREVLDSVRSGLIRLVV